MDNFTNLTAMKHETCPEEETKYQLINQLSTHNAESELMHLTNLT